MMKANGNGRKWLIPLAIMVLGGGGGGIGLYSQVNRMDDRQTEARVRNLENIAVNVTILASHGERLRALEECMRHVAADLERLDTKMDRVLTAVE